MLKLILQDNYHGFLQHAEHICPKGESVSISADGICILLALSKIALYNRRIKTIIQFYSRRNRSYKNQCMSRDAEMDGERETEFL